MTSMLPNAFFYTLSTIAQALAAAIALLSAFVLYRLQVLRTEIDEDSQQIAGLYGGQIDSMASSDAIRALHRQTKYAGVLDFVTTHPIPAGVYKAEVERARLAANLRYQTKLLLTFGIALGQTVLLIAASVSALAAAAGVELWLVSILRFAVGWFVICLINYAYLAKLALK